MNYHWYRHHLWTVLLGTHLNIEVQNMCKYAHVPVVYVYRTLGYFIKPILFRVAAIFVLFLYLTQIYVRTEAKHTHNLVTVA